MCSETPDYLYFIIFIVIYYVYGSIQSLIILSNIHFMCLQALMVLRYSIMIISWPLTSTNLQSHSYLHSFFQHLLSVPSAIILSKCTWSFLPSTKQTLAIAPFFYLFEPHSSFCCFNSCKNVCVLEKKICLSVCICAFHVMLLQTSADSVLWAKLTFAVTLEMIQEIKGVKQINLLHIFGFNGQFNGVWMSFPS